jgi:uncharacterized Zn-binding protein involved in type VI secretion
MRKALIVEGVPTTTGGVVLAGSAHGMTDHGRTFALHGDEATCGKCKGAFKIMGTATRRCYDGRPGVLEGDLVQCPCGKNRVLAGPNPGCFYEDDNGAAGASSVATASNDLFNAYDQHFLLQDERTGTPLSNVLYTITTEDGKQVEGRTDTAGKTQKVFSDTATIAEITVFEEYEPINPNWDK